MLICREGAVSFKVIEIVAGCVTCSSTDYVQRYVHSGPMEISLRISFQIWRILAPNQLQENRLQHVVRIVATSGDRIRCAVDHRRVFAEDGFEIQPGSRKSRFGGDRHSNI